MGEQQKRLYRSRSNKVIAGICGGVGEYLNTDPTIIRVVWLLMTVFGGSGIILYIIAFFVIPETPVRDEPPAAVRSSSSFAFLFGAILIAAGTLVLLDNLDFISFHRWWHLGWDIAIPAVLIIAGIMVMTRRPAPALPPPAAPPSEPSPVNPIPPSPASEAPPASGASRSLRRSLRDRKLLGICGGMALFFGIDATIIRLMYVLFTFLSGGAGVILYVVLFLIVPEEQETAKA